MAKQTRQPRFPQLQGVANYDKLKNTKGYNTFNPFIYSTFNEKAKKNVEASSMDERYLDDDVYYQMIAYNGFNQNIRTGQKLSYYGLDLKIRRQQMIRMSGHGIIDDVLTKLCNEIVVSHDGELPIQLHIKESILDNNNLKKDFREDITKYAQKAFARIVKMYGMGDDGSETSLWNKTWNFLTEGAQAYELVWNDPERPRFITAIHEIDALDTTPFFYNGTRYWKHYKMHSRKQEHIILYDRQVVMIDYSKTQPNSRMSYLEHIMKAFNDLRIVDEATINWIITNSTFRQMLVVPTKGLSRTQAGASVAREMSRWNDEITYDHSTGEVSVNGQARLQMMKSMYVSEGNNGSPRIENFAGDGPDFSDTSKNEFFEKRFYREAKMPLSRFSDSGDSWNIDTRSTLREEIYFGRFVDKLRSTIKKLILHPLRLELVFRYPELLNDDIIDAFDVKFTTYNLFEQLMQLDVLKEKLEFISEINEKLVLQTVDGDDMKYFALDFLIEEYLPEMTKAKLDRNADLRVKQEEMMLIYSAKVAQARAKFSPELNIDPETGVPAIDAIDDEISKYAGNIGDFDELKSAAKSSTQTKSNPDEEEIDGKEKDFDTAKDDAAAELEDELEDDDDNKKSKKQDNDDTRSN